MGDAVLCCRSIRFFFVLFFDNRIVLETKLNVVIFRLVFVPWLLCAECKRWRFPWIHIRVHYVRNGGRVPIVM